VLLSKILQNLANGIFFGNKESGMERLNEFIQDNTENLKKFYSEFAQSSLECTPIQIPENVRQHALIALHEVISKNRASIDSKLTENHPKINSQTLLQYF